VWSVGYTLVARYTLGAHYTLGTRYLLKNTVFVMVIQIAYKTNTIISLRL
jgi:hypothetical protein